MQGQPGVRVGRLSSFGCCRRGGADQRRAGQKRAAGWWGKTGGRAGWRRLQHSDNPSQAEHTDDRETGKEHRAGPAAGHLVAQQPVAGRGRPGSAAASRPPVNVCPATPGKGQRGCRGAEQRIAAPGVGRLPPGVLARPQATARRHVHAGAPPSWDGHGQNLLSSRLQQAGRGGEAGGRGSIQAGARLGCQQGAHRAPARLCRPTRGRGYGAAPHPAAWCPR